ncbi:ABC-three component system protein [Acinetobacter guillouiae]|uniref:ABC-three component system protein n=1 Tax=Acinetobacter guillouiae TaxID=106649 RepID=UPI003AF67E5F
MSEIEEQYPDSAISSWSGFVYQGKIALYHCLKLIHEGDVNFELQLDSTDDFAIYKGGVLSSAHQVKAKIGKYRSNYKEALEKSAKIELDRIKGSVRYFHISIPISDTSDYIDGNGEMVRFYSYGGEKHCGLADIESLTKLIITNICTDKKILLGDKLLSINYCLLSEKISSKALEIHKKIQADGDSERRAAYLNRITGQNILDELINNNPYNDADYYAIDLKFRLQEHLEDRLDQSLPGMSNLNYVRALKLYEHIHITPAHELRQLCQLMKPSERFNSLQKNDIRKYMGLIQAIVTEPVLDKVPHYLCNKSKFYIPTAIDLPEVEENIDCSQDIQSEMRSNEDLLELLYEYNNLIACRAKESFLVQTRYTVSTEFDKAEKQEESDSHITKMLCISILTKEDAEARLNDY